MFSNRIKLHVTGKNISRFIKKLSDNNIELLSIKYQNDGIDVIVYQKDYKHIEDIKSVYDIACIDVYGLIRIKKNISKYKSLLLGIMISLSLIIFLSNIIFNVEVIDTDSKFRNMLLKELENYGITKYKFKKHFDQLQIIKNAILDKYKDSIEWLEIESKGTKYVIRLEKRIIKDKASKNIRQHIVAGKSGIIKRIVANKGQIVKEIDSYVNKGDIVISGNIYLNDILKDTVTADGNIYAEVWYNVSVECPYVYSYITYTGKEKKVLTLNILSKTLEFTNNKFIEKMTDNRNIINHNILPISLSWQYQKQINTESGVLTVDEAISKAKEIGIKKINDKLKYDESILHYKVLKTIIDEDKVILNMFFAVQENITEVEIIEGVD